MDDSDQDFVDLCSKLLKRVRRKAGDTQAEAGDKRKNKKDGDSGSRCATAVSATQTVSTMSKQPVVNGGFGHDSGDAGSSVSVDSGVPVEAGETVGLRGLRAKEKVLLRMRQFKRASPPRMVHKEKKPSTSTSGLHPEPQDSDEALALRLQQELDREAAEAQTMNLEDGGLFFCQLCHRDLSHISPEGRTQHLNRCLDKNEDAAPAPPPPPPPPGVPDCPICGKRFKSQKSRSAHLKRCSSDMGVAPADLLQALQRQAAEAQTDSAANQLAQTGGAKRKGPSEPLLRPRKKPRKKTQSLDEDTMVALALSSSLLDQEVEREIQRETAASHTSMTPLLKWRPDAGKGRGKRRKGGVPRPPPLLLVQDAEAALQRLQERVSALLLRSRGPSPPTPTRCPSSLPAWSGAAPLWQKSALQDGGPTCLSEFYTPELREFIVPWEKAMVRETSFTHSPDSSVRPVGEGTPVPVTRSSTLPSSSQTAPSPAPSTPGTGQVPVGSQALKDLMELAEDGMTLTQWGYTVSRPTKDKQSSAGLTPDLHLSGFVLEEPEEQADLCLSGFLPETTPTHTERSHRQARRRRPTGRPGADEERGSHKSVALSRLTSDLSSMVNNPQLSDVQLQVDSGEVYFAHSFMLYARCPLLAQMVHDSGFGVQEEGMPAAQRVLMGEVPGQAVCALLQYLYTSHCPISASLLPHVLELASRFDLEELRQLCQRHQEEAVTQGEGADGPSEEQQSEDQTDQAFMELLRSMWNEEDEDDDGTDTDGGRDGEVRLEKDSRADDLASGDGEIREEQVNEEEMEEIYEFAATQRKREEEKDSTEEEEEEKVDEKEEGDLEMEEDQVFAKPNITEPTMNSTVYREKKQQPISHCGPDPSLDRSYSRLFSDSWGVYEEEDLSSPPSTSTRPLTTQIPQSQQHHSPLKPSSRTDKTCLQSSASVVIDLSISPPPTTSNLPLPGWSPGQMSDQGGGGDEGTDAYELDVAKEFSKERVHPREESPSPKRESQGPRSICVPLSPAAPQSSKEPELIVLSDSSEEMEVDLAAVGIDSPPPRSPRSIQNLRSYTQIKPQSIPEPNAPTLENKESSSLELSPTAPSAAPVPGRPGSGCDGLDPSPVDCSPEVSWLIPATPVHPSRSTSTSSSSTQTHSSMRRTQLFPKSGTLSSSSSAFSSPALPLKDRLHTSNNPPRVSAHVCQTEGSVSRMKLDRSIPSSSSLDRNHPHKMSNSGGMRKDREVDSPVFAVPPSQPKRSRPSSFPHSHPLHSQDASMQVTPLHIHSHPYSSTPLHTDLPKPSLLSTSPLHSDPDREGSTGQGRVLSEGELGSLRLSLSDPSDSPSSSSHRGLPSSRKDSRSSSGQSGRCVESDYHNNTGTKVTRRVGDEAREMRNEEGEGVVEGEDKGTGAEGERDEAMSAQGEMEEADFPESSFRQSFMAMDEPPMAFNDSWGFDAAADREGNPGVCFSLRLEDSGGTSPHERSLGREETAGSSSSTVSQPPTSSHATDSFQSHNHGRNTTSPPPKLHTTQPSTSLSPAPKTHTHTGPSFTPSPPDPTTRTTPEVNTSFLDPKIWDSWEEEEEEEEPLPLSQRVNPVARLKTPVSSRSKRRVAMVPITPMPSYSDMDTPDLKSKLNRFGVRPLPKRQMILKLKEIHQYTHQLVSSESEDEAPSVGRTAQAKPLPTSSTAAPSSRPASCARTVKFKQPRAPAAVSPVKHSEEDAEPLSASQGSNTSSTAASEDSERSNPELCQSSDSDSDGAVTASQAASRLQDRLRAVRSFILSDPELYSQILQYQPLVLSQLQERLKAAGIRLGGAKLLDYLDSQCITFTTAKPGHTAPSRRRGKTTKAAGERGVRGRKRKVVTAMD
ncbi:structure-specific endonuclease subunit SLX4 [Centroberyx gerrardi]